MRCQWKMSARDFTAFSVKIIGFRRFLAKIASWVQLIFREMKISVTFCELGAAFSGFSHWSDLKDGMLLHPTQYFCQQASASTEMTQKTRTSVKLVLAFSCGRWDFLRRSLHISFALRLKLALSKCRSPFRPRQLLRASALASSLFKSHP